MTPASRTLRRALVAAGLAVVVLSVYWQVGSHPFMEYDDQDYVYRNPVVRQGLTGDGIAWALTATRASNWHPLTWISHMADVELFGLEAGWHHRVNVALHLLNAIALFLVLEAMTGAPWRSAFVAALFAAHPLHVESVAWVAERKDVLSTLFLLLSLGAYLAYVRRPGPARYLGVAALFALGLSSKPMLVTFPFVLLLLDYWPLGRLAGEAPPEGPPPAFSGRALVRRALEKAPLFALSAASSAVTVVAQARGHMVMPLESLPLASRVSNALVSYAAYLAKTVWPASLAVFYPNAGYFSKGGTPAWQAAGAAALLCALSIAAYRVREKRPSLAVGWLWYLGTLVPVIGIVQVAAIAMADRYTYVPLAGVFIAVAWAAGDLAQRRAFRRVVPAVAGAVIALLAGGAWVQAGYWRSEVALFGHSAAVTDNNWLSLYNLGGAYDKEGQPLLAVESYRRALAIKPDAVQVWFNLGVACARLDRPGDAAAAYGEALRLRPDYVKARYNLAMVLVKYGKPEEAAAHFREILRANPGDRFVAGMLDFIAAGGGRQPRPDGGRQPRPDAR